MTAVKADGIAARQVQTLRQCQGPRPRREASPHRREEKLMQNERSRMTGLKIKECASAILISTDGRFLFQLRDNVPGISDQGSSAFLVVAGRVTRAFWTALSVKFTKRLDILFAQPADVYKTVLQKAIEFGAGPKT